MKYKSIILMGLVAGVMMVSSSSCDDANEPETKRVTVNGFKEQDPAGYAAYTSALRSWKATPHQVMMATLHNAPAISVSERDYLRSIPDSVDFVTMARAHNLTDFDRQDMALVRTDFGTRVLYGVDSPDLVDAATQAVVSGAFDGVDISSSQAVAPLLAALQGSTCTKVYSGNLSDLSTDAVAAFDYFKIDAGGAVDAFDIDYAVRMALLTVPAEKMILAVRPGNSVTDAYGVTRNSIAAAAKVAMEFSPRLGGVSVSDISADYYDPDIIYKRTRGAIQMLNPAAKQ